MEFIKDFKEKVDVEIFIKKEKIDSFEDLYLVLVVEDINEEKLEEVLGYEEDSLKVIIEIDI